MFKTCKDKSELYITSLWLLFLLIIVITMDFNLPQNNHPITVMLILSKNIIPLISFFFLLLGIFFVVRFKYKLKGSNNSYFIIKNVNNKNYEHLTFLTTYIIPLICFDLSKLRYILILFILLIIIGAIYIRTDMFYANPTLALLGYKLYEVDAELRDGYKEQLIVITRERITDQSKVVYKKLDDKIYFVRSIQ